MGKVAWYHRAHPDAPYKPTWSDVEIARLRAIAPRLTAAMCAAAIGRSRKSVEAKAIRLGIRFGSPDTNTARGRVGEAIALTLLPGAHHLSAEDYHAPVDLDWNGQAIDVKVGRRRSGGVAATIYSFSIKAHSSADAFLCLAMDGERLERAWLIPAWALTNVRGGGITIGAGSSKYDAFEMQGVA